MAHSEQTARPEQPAHSSEHPARVCAEVAHASARVNGVELHYAHAGNGPLMLFLHGFPQNWYQYRHLLADFSRDHLAVAPDMRGHNLSSKLQDVHRYSTCTLVEDVRQLVERLGYELFVLVGHDVGGAIAWSFALHHPEMLSALVILDTPHPALFDNALHNDPEQQQASAYMLTARRPDAAGVFSADDFRVLRDSLDEPFIGARALRAGPHVHRGRRSDALARGGAPRARHPVDPRAPRARGVDRVGSAESCRTMRPGTCQLAPLSHS